MLRTARRVLTAAEDVCGGGSGGAALPPLAARRGAITRALPVGVEHNRRRAAQVARQRPAATAAAPVPRPVQDRGRLLRPPAPTAVGVGSLPRHAAHRECEDVVVAPEQFTERDRAQVERRLNFNEFLEGSRAAFLRVNELIGREDVDELRPLVSNNVFKSIKQSMLENAKVSDERPLLEILDMHQFVDSVELQRGAEATKLWMYVDVCYAYTFKLRYNNRDSSQQSESQAPDGVQERDSRLRFKALIADRRDRDHEPMWKIVELQS